MNYKVAVNNHIAELQKRNTAEKPFILKGAIIKDGNPVYMNSPLCPNCTSGLEDSNGTRAKFCPMCGQRIDWTGYKEK